MYKRILADYLLKVAPQYPVVTLIGPRQSGKSTLSRTLFPNYTYTSLETPDIRALATEDPRGFFKRFPGRLIIDEVQRVPELLSYIQTFVDEPGFAGQFVLTGSHQLLLMEKITQSLAGRSVIAKLLPFSLKELQSGPALPVLRNIDQLLFTGGYPRIYDKDLNPRQWLEQYYQTYVERDVRSVLQIGQIDLFDRFIRLCAGRVGQLINYSSLAADCGISPPTANSWLSILQTSFVCFTLQPHFENFSKRIIKTPKMYFYDTGLLCYLLKIQEPDQLASHPLRGNIFENWVVTEMVKSFLNKGEEPPLYFWRDQKQHEVDLIIDRGTELFPIEIKSSYTINVRLLDNLKYFASLLGKQPQGECIYAGTESYDVSHFKIRSWQDI